jgi:hypothetical protein
VNATYVLEKGISRLSTHEYEEDIARRWWDLPLNVTLPFPFPLTSLSHPFPIQLHSRTSNGVAYDERRVTDFFQPLT